MLVWEGFQQNCDSEGHQAYMSISSKGTHLPFFHTELYILISTAQVVQEATNFNSL